ncbi:uncharacterized protein METZ01_LOCUS228062 [marine metagenome]|uniref:Molybdopterin synthase sulfur carrier subunit n=1 Tax=marine metagenome TaxID=408172 RepID=A0A382GJ93_9ZZZZ
MRDIAGAGEFERPAHDGATVRHVWEALVDEFEELRAYDVSISTAVNAEYSQMDAPVADGDEVAFLPPVSGG